MVSQAQPVESRITDQALESVARSSTGFAEEAVALIELQAQLIAVESRELSRQLYWPCLLGSAAALLAAGLVPVAFVTVAVLLFELTELSLGAALLLSLGLGVGIIAALASICFRQWQSMETPFSHSTREWKANQRWFRNMLKRHRRRW